MPSFGVGLVLYLTTDGLLKTFGLQEMIWGSIETLISCAGLWHGRARLRAADAGQIRDDRYTEEMRRLHRFLTINVACDCVYFGTGLVIIFARGFTNHYALGHGLGIVVQALYLFIFDIVFTQRAGRLANGRKDD